MRSGKRRPPSGRTASGNDKAVCSAAWVSRTANRRRAKQWANTSRPHRGQWESFVSHDRSKRGPESPRLLEKYNNLWDTQQILTRSSIFFINPTTCSGTPKPTSILFPTAGPRPNKKSSVFITTFIPRDRNRDDQGGTCRVLRLAWPSWRGVTNGMYTPCTSPYAATSQSNPARPEGTKP